MATNYSTVTDKNGEIIIFTTDTSALYYKKDKCALSDTMNKTMSIFSNSDLLPATVDVLKVENNLALIDFTDLFNELDALKTTSLRDINDHYQVNLSVCNSYYNNRMSNAEIRVDVSPNITNKKGFCTLTKLLV